MMGASEYLSVNKLQKQRKNCLDWGTLSLQRLPKWTAWSAHCFPVEVTRCNHMSMFMHHNKDCNCVIVHSRKSASPQGLAYHKWTSPKISHSVPKQQAPDEVLSICMHITTIGYLCDNVHLELGKMSQHFLVGCDTTHKLHRLTP